MTDSPEYITLTDPDTGDEVQIRADLVYGNAGDEKPIPLAITGDIFYAASTIPGEEQGKLAALLAELKALGDKADKDGDSGSNAETVNRQVALILTMVELFLLPESAQKLADRFRSKERPIDVATVMKVVADFLSRVYPQPEDGDGRPTKPTSA